MKTTHPKNQFKSINIIFVLFILILLFILSLIILKDAPEQRIVLLSFDVEPVDGEQSVLKVLDSVSRHNLSVTFFVTGEYVHKYQDIVKMMDENEVGVHGFSHKPFTRMKRDEKLAEIRTTKWLLDNVTGQKAIGFRAPYNKLDSETLDVLDEEGFLYDASIIGGLGLFYPNIGERNIGEIPVSSVIGIPLEDVVFFYFLRMPSAFFYVLKNKQGEIESYDFHPHHIAKHQKEFDDFINHLKKQNVIFISHRELIEMQDEGV